MDDMSRMWVDALEQAGFTTHYAREAVEKVLHGEDQDDQEAAVNDLITFLRARLDEDEQAAQRAKAREGDWPSVVAAADYWDGSLGDFVVRHDPARVLAEVQAKRAILVDHTTPHTVGEDGWCYEEGGQCTHAGESECAWHALSPCPTIRALASVYRDHPDFRPEWAPEGEADV